MRRPKPWPATLLLSALIVPGMALAAAEPARWVAGYASSPIGYEPKIRDAPAAPLRDVTVREVVRVSAAGSALRVRLSNELGTGALRIGAASIARADQAGAAMPGTLRPLLFAGAAGVTIPDGAPMLSDEVAGPVERGADYVVTLFLPGESMPAAHAQLVEIAPGDQTASAALTGATRARTAGIVSEIDVAATAPTHALVTLGDSITEGAASTPGAHMSWPDQLARMLATASGGRCWSVANAGISGNRLLHDGRGPNALARFDRDVLSVPGARTIVLLEGINDIGASAQPGRAADEVSADAIIAADREIIARAHARGLRVIGATLTPYEGAGYATPAGEAKRVAVNSWIRTGGMFDGVIDFEAATRDPSHPTRMDPGADSGDHLHPKDAGYTRMAQAALPVVLREGCGAGGTRP